MVANLAVHSQAQYGGIELKQFYQRRWFYGFTIAVTLHMLALGAYFLAGSHMDSPERGDLFKDVIYLPSPPSVVSSYLPPAVQPRSIGKQSRGIPKPVADVSVDPDNTIASQNEVGSAHGEEMGVGLDEGFPESGIDLEEPPPDFVYTEKDPVLIRQVQPVYPVLAIKAGLEGTVWLKIWVDKEGKPRQVVVVKSDSEVFTDAAVSAARQFLFAPAYTNSGAVSVWVSLPFRFKLTGGG